MSASGKGWRFATRVIHEAQEPAAWGSATLPPLYQTAAHRYETAEQLSDVFAGKEKGFIYMRLRNPTNQALEKKLAGLESGQEAVVTGSGMAAITDALLAIAKAGDEIVAGNSLFMSTYLLFANVFKKFGIAVRFVETTRLEEFAAAINDRTRAIFVETIGNPKMDVPDLDRLAELAHSHQVPLVVDNTVATPYLCRPIEHGADVVVCSTTKYCSGHGDAVGGAVIDSYRFPWPLEKYPDFKLFKERQGERAYIDKVWREIHINFGTAQAPLHSYLTMVGLDTLALRMERHCANALALARHLKTHPKVRWINYPGLEDDPSHAAAKRLFAGQGFGGMLAFGLEDREACFRCIKSLKLAYHLANLGDCKTLVIHPASSQYVSFDPAVRESLSITQDLVRVSVGIEAIEDIVADFDQALAQA